MISLEYFNKNKNDLTLADALIATALKIIRDIKTKEMEEYVKEKILDNLHNFKLTILNEYGDDEIDFELTKKQINKYLKEGMEFFKEEDYNKYFLSGDFKDEFECFYIMLEKEKLINDKNISDVNLNYIIEKYLALNEEMFKDDVEYYGEEECGTDWYINYELLEEYVEIEVFSYIHSLVYNDVNCDN